MYRAKDVIFYENLEYIMSKNNLTLSDLSYKLDINYKSLHSLFTRKTFIQAKHGKKIAQRLSFNEYVLFNESLKKKEVDMRLYQSGDDYMNIHYAYNIGSITSQEAFERFCGLLKNSFISFYFNDVGRLAIDENSIPKISKNSSSWMIRIDNSVSSKDPQAAFRAYEMMIEREYILMKWLVFRINACFPGLEDQKHYKKIFIYDFIQGKNYKWIKARRTFVRGYSLYLREKEIARKFAYRAFELKDEETREKIFDEIRCVNTETGEVVTDNKRKQQIFATQIMEEYMEMEDKDNVFK